MNGFVEYLNSTNNVGGNSTGSLAEAQVKSKYFDLVKVDRKLGRYIADTVKRREYRTFILTGHAGDGKTSVLVQVLKELYLLSPGEKLEQIKEYQDFCYVKDMSEIAETQQIEVLKNTLSAPSRRKTSLLISNTGPLLKTFLSLAAQTRKANGMEFGDDERISLSSKLLTQLDNNSDQEIDVEGYRFYLVNIARVDNVAFSSAIFRKIVAADLWEDCSRCECCSRCPIKKNVDRVNAQLDRVTRFVEAFYRYLYENDKRMTIRQMVGQLSFALTGNLTCEDIADQYLKEPFFNYSFANLFFGYIGLNDSRDSSQIKGVFQTKLLKLDSIALDVDYRLFVNQDYAAFFTPDIAEELGQLKKKHQKHYQSQEEEEAYSSSEQQSESKFRRAIRRFYLLFSADRNEEKIFNQIFGENYTLYEQLISAVQTKSVLRKVQSLVFRALYIKNTGFLPDNANALPLPLTLRRENGVFQNVMLVLGTVPKNSLVIVQKPVLNMFEDTDSKQELCLRLNEEEFPLTLPMLTYFGDLIHGAISSNSNPALTHGIAKLDALLLDQFRDEVPDREEDCELRLLIQTTGGQVIRNFAFDDNRLIILS